MKDTGGNILRKDLSAVKKAHLDALVDRGIANLQRSVDLALAALTPHEREVLAQRFAPYVPADVRVVHRFHDSMTYAVKLVDRAYRVKRGRGQRRNRRQPIGDLRAHVLPLR